MHQAEPAFFLKPQKKYCDFGRSAVSNPTEPYSDMHNSKLFVSGISLLVLTLAAPLTSEAQRGGGGRGGSGGHFGGMSHGGFSRGGMGPGGFYRGGMAPGGARFSGANWNRGGANWNRTAWNGRNGANWSGRNWSGRNNWHSGNWNNNWRNNNGRWSWWNGHRWCFPRNNVVFIGGFGFPWWWGWGSGPWAGWGGGWGSPYGYGYYGGGDPYSGGGYGSPYYGYGNGYGNGYGAEMQYGRYGNSSQSRVAELQQRLSRAGYYHGSVDGVLGPKTRAAIRAYEQEHGDVG
jgi:hypothetical protein